MEQYSTYNGINRLLSLGELGLNFVISLECIPFFMFLFALLYKYPMWNSISIRLVAAVLLVAVNMPVLASDNGSDDLSASRRGVRTSTDVVLVALPAAAIAGTLIAGEWEGLKQGTFTAASAVGMTYLLKYTVRERRPDGGDYHSFPSGHSAFTFASAAYVQRRYGWSFGAPAYVLAGYTAWGRVYSRRHHWWDVAAGGAIGVGSAYLFTKPWAKKHELSIEPIAGAEYAGLHISFIL